MLHAMLRGKLSEDVPEPQRLEDALTSTVVGTLLLVDARDALHSWMRKAEYGAADLGFSPLQAWFWPRLALAEPDVILRLGNQLFVIEAKYRSGRHDRAASNSDEMPDAQEVLSDQIVRQARSIQAIRDGHICPEPGLADAIRTSTPVFVYLVDQRRMRKARGQFLESRGRLAPQYDLRLLTWQALYSLLHVTKGQRWVEDLLAYLDAAGLDAFCGFRSVSATPERALRLHGWRAGGSWAGLEGLRSVVLSGARVGVASLRRWRIGDHVRGTRAAVAGLVNPEIMSSLRRIAVWPKRRQSSLLAAVTNLSAPETAVRILSFRAGDR